MSNAVLTAANDATYLA